MQAADLLRLTPGVDALAMRNAGYSLEDLLRARDELHLVMHPPASGRTLFDSQLKKAGYSALDFFRAGYSAKQLSYEYFKKEAEITLGLWNWELLYAFFGASELQEAVYSASQLQDACFSSEDLQQTGFSEGELQCAIHPKARPSKKRRIE